MSVEIDSIMQLGVGWEITFRPPEAGETLQNFFADQGFRVGSLRTENRPEGDMGCLEIEEPGGERSKQQVFDLLNGNPAFDASRLELADLEPSQFADEG